MADQADIAAPVHGSSFWLKSLDRLASMGARRAVAYSRLVLAAVALVAIYLDPTQPARFSQLTYGILAAYVAASLLIVFAEHLLPADSRRSLTVHVLDVAVAVLLVYLTEGPTSPFFTFFTLVMVSGTLSWGSRGAAVTALVIVLAFVGITAVQATAGEAVDLNRTIVRTAYLVVAAFLLTYFGWYRQRNEARLQHLAAWPTTTPGGPGEDPQLSGPLEHAARAMGVERLLVIWEDESDPTWRLAHWTGTHCLVSQWTPATHEDPVAEALAGGSFVWSAGTLTQPDGSAPLRHSPLAPSLAEQFRIASFSAAPFEVPPFAGTLIVIEPGPPSPELLALTELIAGRIGIEFEHHRLQRDLAATTLNRERARLARDLHDGILQDLTAAGLHLKVLSRKVAPGGDATFTEIIELLMEQQARIRAFVEAMNPKAPGSTVSLGPMLETTAAALGRQWGCRIAARVEPEGTQISATEELQLRLILAEAIANAARHGGASSVEIAARAEDRVVIEVFDNGTAGDRVGAVGKAAPFSLAQRVTEMGGSCRLEVSATGAHLFVDLPRT